jgi:hypothetical protein
LEVHHHPDLEHHKKHFREYFLEFLMIFLAVSLGFIAENLREHFSEQERASVLANSMFADIKKDTAALHSDIDFTLVKIKKLDSALSLLKQPANQRDNGALYRNLYIMVAAGGFEKTKGTYEQLKNSGSLRYFDQDLVDKLNGYDVAADKTKSRDDLNNKIIVDIILPGMLKKLNFELVYQLINNKPLTGPFYFNGFDLIGVNEVTNYLMLSKRGCDLALIQYRQALVGTGDILTSLHSKFEL